MADHDYNPNCGCPGCQYLWAAEKMLEKFGPPPIIGTFEPTHGDIGRDLDHPLAVYRTWMGSYWWPLYEIVPKGSGMYPKTKQDS